MNQIEAKELIEKGVKVTHPGFKKGGWVTKHPKSKRHYQSDSEQVIDITSFWRYRTGIKWNKGWEVLKDQNG